MKKNIRLVMIFINILALSACYEDKGKYDYLDYAKVEIGLPGMYGESLLAYVGDVVTIDPEIKWEDPQDSVNFDFSWKIGDVEISKKQKLEYMFSEATLYFVSLDVTERKTGYVTRGLILVKASSRYLVGWLVLSDLDGKSSLSFIHPDSYETYPDIYRNLHPDDELGSEPFRLEQHFLTLSDEVLVMQKGGDGCVELNGLDFKKVIRTEQEFVDEKYPTGFEPVQLNYSGAIELILGSDGRLIGRYNEAAGSAFQTAVFGDEPLYHPGGLNVSYLVQTKSSQRGVKYNYFFEEGKKRFLGVETNSSNMKILDLMNNYSSSVEFVDLADYGDNKLIYCGAYSETADNASFVNIFKNNIGKYYIQTYKATNRDDVLEVTEPFQSIFPGNDIVSDQTVYYKLRTRPYLFFGEGTGLYYYDLETKRVEPFHTFTSGTITHIVANPQNEELGVALSSGEFYILDITDEALVMKPVKVLHQTRGLGKIVSTIFKYGRTANYDLDTDEYR